MERDDGKTPASRRTAVTKLGGIGLTEAQADAVIPQTQETPAQAEPQVVKKQIRGLRRRLGAAANIGSKPDEANEATEPVPAPQEPPVTAAPVGKNRRTTHTVKFGSPLTDETVERQAVEDEAPADVPAAAPAQQPSPVPVAVSAHHDRPPAPPSVPESAIQKFSSTPKKDAGPTAKLIIKEAIQDTAPAPQPADEKWVVVPAWEDEDAEDDKPKEPKQRRRLAATVLSGPKRARSTVRSAVLATGILAAGAAGVGMWVFNRISSDHPASSSGAPAPGGENSASGVIAVELDTSGEVPSAVPSASVDAGAPKPNRVRKADEIDQSPPAELEKRNPRSYP